MPVMMPAAAILSSYIPYAASCDSSRNGLPASISARTRSRGNNLPRDACRARADSPPPPSIAAIVSRKSATSAAIAARFSTNVGSRVDSLVVRITLSLERREAGGQQNEYSADDAAQPPCRPGAAAQSAAGATREPGDRQINEEAVEIEQAAQRQERQRFRWRVCGDELRQESEEEKRDLRIENVDDESFAEDSSRPRRHD